MKNILKVLLAASFVIVAGVNAVDVEVVKKDCIRRVDDLFSHKVGSIKQYLVESNFDINILNQDPLMQMRLQGIQRQINRLDDADVDADEVLETITLSIEENAKKLMWEIPHDVSDEEIINSYNSIAFLPSGFCESGMFKSKKSCCDSIRSRMQDYQKEVFFKRSDYCLNKK